MNVESLANLVPCNLFELPESTVKEIHLCSRFCASWKVKFYLQIAPLHLVSFRFYNRLLIEDQLIGRRTLYGVIRDARF